jgi:hypothetical protein
MLSVNTLISIVSKSFLDLYYEFTMIIMINVPNHDGKIP